MWCVSDTVRIAMEGIRTFCKFLSANDTGETGGHQSGIYISKPSVKILFDIPGKKGENKERWVTVNWMNEIQTRTRFVYYGQGTRNEYRITNFGRNFPYLSSEHTGSLFVLTEVDSSSYFASVLDTEEQIHSFLDRFGISPAETNQLLDSNFLIPEIREKEEIDRFLNTAGKKFPASEEMSAEARILSYLTCADRDIAVTDPDNALILWTSSEYRLFRIVEQANYGSILSAGFDNLDTFISTANKVLNRRKSRAGKSLEHHLAALFDANHILYSAQAVTEGKKRPDFIFPSVEAYHDPEFSDEKLNTLAAKTTCKDRWRQVLNEADRMREKTKFLCTLQQGISSSQLDEMEREKVVLVVPKPYISSYPADRRHRIWTVRRFIDYVKESEGI